MMLSNLSKASQVFKVQIIRSNDQSIKLCFYSGLSEKKYRNIYLHGLKNVKLLFCI